VVQLSVDFWRQYFIMSIIKSIYLYEIIGQQNEKHWSRQQIKSFSFVAWKQEYSKGQEKRFWGRMHFAIGNPSESILINCGETVIREWNDPLYHSNSPCHILRGAFRVKRDDSSLKHAALNACDQRHRQHNLLFETSWWIENQLGTIIQCNITWQIFLVQWLFSCK